ncbi:MAG: hypothetical protein HY078_10605 [Elusimicrobia bacterium]|nr:hypothetical protein [Elusimicrobiota bacterium]
MERFLGDGLASLCLLLGAAYGVIGAGSVGLLFFGKYTADIYLCIPAFPTAWLAISSGRELRQPRMSTAMETLAAAGGSLIFAVVQVVISSGATLSPADLLFIQIAFIPPAVFLAAFFYARHVSPG